jgi:hypothetical protein
MRTLTFVVPDDQWDFLVAWGKALSTCQPAEIVAAAFLDDSITQRRDMHAKFADAGQHVDARLSKGGERERT